MINHKYGSNTGDKSIDINTIYVGGDYLNTMGIELLEGRDFLDGDLNKACLLNEEALKQLGWENFEGERCSIGQEGGYEVIGVIKDSNSNRIILQWNPWLYFLPVQKTVMCCL